jgi:pimeloyl-ACP methyl ester carboxylesterase
MGTVRGAAFAARDQSSIFNFVTVDGVRLRYFETGRGMPPVVLLHGNGSMIEDFVCSGVVDHAASRFQFIAFDRPGFGYSTRPSGRAWGPCEQAKLLLNTLARLGVERPVVVGHSWGTLVALAMALERPEQVAGLVLLSGYYYPVPRAPAILASAAFPFTSDVVRYTVRRLMAPETLRRVFAPCIVPERFKRAYPLYLATRLSQMKTVEEEAAGLLHAAQTLCRVYHNVSVPVHLIAGSEDRIVDTELHSARLHQELANSTFDSVPGRGHMVHHAVPDRVVSAIDMIGRVRRSMPRAVALDRSPRRSWLQIDEHLVAA